MQGRQHITLAALASHCRECLFKGEVPASDGSGTRQDASSVVVLDGLMTAGERPARLMWLTADGWDGCGAAPPDDKGAQNCVDHVDSDAGRKTSTWGLQEHVVQVRRRYGEWTGGARVECRQETCPESWQMCRSSETTDIRSVLAPCDSGPPVA